MTELIEVLKKIAEELGSIDQTLNSLLVIYTGTVADKKDYREGSRTADVVIERLANNAEQFLTDFHQFVLNIVGESEKEAGDV